MKRAGLLLIGEGFSPWTEKALWALEHHRLDYRYEEYAPLASEPWLRLRARRLRGPISVPYLLGPDLSLGDSFAIAAEADRLGAGTPLLPPELRAAISAWNERSERLMRAGRAQILARTDASTAVQVESVPAFVPRPLRRAFAGSVRIGTAYLRRKYDVRAVADAELEPELEAVRAAIRERAASSPRDARPAYLLGTFTLADIAMATALQAVRPHARYPLGLRPAQREAWARTELAARWEDVLAWRDAMIDRHRPRASDSEPPPRASRA